LYPAQGLDLVAEEAARRDQRLGESLARLAGRKDCPLIFASDAAASPDAAENPGLAALRARGIPVYPSPERAVRALAALVRRGRALLRPESPPPRGGTTDASASAARALESAARAGCDRLVEDEAARVLAGCGVTFADHETVSAADAAAAAARRIGFPVVLKGLGPTLAHKSDRGLVLLGLTDDAAVRDGAARLLREAGVDRVIVAQHVFGRREVLLGWLRDPIFGPLGVLGIGGVLTEALADAAFVHLPVTAAELADAAQRLRARAVFGRFRGEREVDCTALARALNGLWELGEASAVLQSVDINPLVIRSDGTPIAVDALITLAMNHP
jgi:hypothetical protein